MRLIKDRLKKLLVSLIMLGGALHLSPMAAGEVTYYHTDALGSIVASSDESGNLKWEEQYTPYGGRIKNEGAAVDDEVWYTGKPQDKETGLVYMNARYYDPGIGRFYSVDPETVIRHIESNPMMFNRYAYANNNPYKYIDPNGEIAILAVPAIKLAAQVTVAMTGVVSGAYVSEEVIQPAINAYNESADSDQTASGSTETDKKGQGQAEVGTCPTCGETTSKKPGKIGKEHDLKPKEVREKIHKAKSGRISGNPDIEVCNNCGEIFPQTDDGGLGDSIGNIEED